MNQITFTLLSILLGGNMLLPVDSANALSISPDGRHLLSPEGSPVFFNADAPWHILARLDREDTLLYLNTRRAQGFNALMVSIIVNDDYRTGSFDNAFGEPPFLVPEDFSTPNEAYFAHVDWFLAEAQQRGMTVLLFPAYIGYNCEIEGFCGAMKLNGPTKMREYGRWLGRRYSKFPNIIWVDGGDTDASTYGAMEVVTAVAEGLRETSPEHLHSAHCNRLASAADCYDFAWLDINSTYADCEQTPRRLRTDYDRATVRPSFYIEGIYEGESNASDVCIRSQAYWSILGGAIGHCFGNRPMWDFWDGWKTALTSPGSRSMQYFGELVRSRDWSRFVPDWDHTVLTAGFGSLDDGSYAAAARTLSGSTVMIYAPDQRTLTVDMTKVSGDRAVSWWFNPSNGTSVFIQTFPTTGSRDFTPPFSGDWVLILDDENARLPAPGDGVGTESTSPSAFKSWFRP